ncbi:bifunctional diguanylate cyclase/phosphodiesterase [Sneathiella glossodoripedis]|uniref:bifunctional diguanylate cyclase/phosphodiesterase n=1 Tax=Sneathiella glossodoripedis TaxID=418853 RepID=UPI00047208CF|nr:EAL domain-containing protein [Sneathiella glossodoripedis]
MSSVRINLPGQEQIKVSPEKTEKLLRAISKMQACRHTQTFYRTTLFELCNVFEDIEYCAFLLEDNSGSGFRVVAKNGDVPHKIPAEEISLLKQCLQSRQSVFTQNIAALALVGDDHRYGAILVKSERNWKSEDFRLLRQYANNATRGFETAQLLEEAEELAFQDRLTHLENRVSFKKSVSRRLMQCREKGSFAVVQFVLDNLSELNIALGYATGDELICQAAEELTKLFPSAVSIARTSGNGFAVCVDLESEDDFLVLPHLINDLFDLTLPDKYGLPHLSPTIGLTRYPQDGDNADKLWKNTSTALANANKLKTNNYCYYDNQIEVEIHGRVTLNRALREGLGKKQLSLNYQPQISLSSGRMVGAEALLRWKRDGGEYVPADTFIPIAEASGLLGPISEWVIEEACKQRVEWTRQGVPEFPVAVNISLNEFQSEDFVPLVQRILNETGMPAQLLDIELTESVIMEDRGQTKRNMERLKELGVRLSIDDFGTGYSSLSYLSHLPASVLKIDKSFVDGIVQNKNDAAIAMTIISLGYNLGMKILAEGVENKEQIEFLKKAGCHEAQGFTFSRPVKPHMIPQLARRQDYLNVS